MSALSNVMLEKKLISGIIVHSTKFLIFIHEQYMINPTEYIIKFPWQWEPTVTTFFFYLFNPCHFKHPKN